MNTLAKTKFNSGRIRSIVLNNAVYIFGIAAVAVFSMLSEYFFTGTNFLTILRNSTTMLSVGIGLVFVLMVGELDLSVGANLRFCASVSAVLMVNYNLNPYLCLLLMPVIGMIVGMVNGLLVTRLKLNAWLVTLAMKLVLVGIVVFTTKTVAINMPKMVTQFRNIKLFSLPSYVILALVLMIAMQIFLKYSVTGRSMVAIGSNTKAADRLGISVKKYKFLAFVICGLFAGIGAMMISINLGSITRELGDGYEFTAVTAIVLGGVSLEGGIGSVFPCAFAGVMIVMILENGLAMLGVDAYWFAVVRAVIIFVMMYIDSIKRKI